MEKKVLGAYAAIQVALCCIGKNLKEFSSDESGASEIVAVVAVAAVAVVLALVFQEQLKTFIGDAVNSFKSQLGF